MPSERGDAAAQLANALEECDEALRTNGFDGLGDVFFAHLYLKDLSQFSAVNSVFEAAFSRVKKGPVSFLRPGPFAKWCGVYFGCGGHYQARSTLHVRSEASGRRSVWALTARPIPLLKV